MADDKTVNLRVDGSQGEQALQGIERAAEGAAEAMGALGAEVEKTETQTKRLAGTSRDYNSAARSVGDSVQAITRFEAAYRASLNDTANSAQVRAQILEAAFRRNIGGAADEQRAVQLLSAGHKDAAAAVQVIAQYQNQLAAAANAAAQAESIQAAITASNARGMGEYAAQLQAVARAQELNQRAASRAGEVISPSIGGKSAGESAGVFAAAFREEEAAANAAAQAERRALQARLENERISRQWEAELEAEARASRDASAAQEKQAQTARALLQTYAPAIAQGKTLREHEQQLNSLLASGTLTTQQHAVAMRSLQNQQAINSVEMARATSGAKLNAYALSNLSYQVNDVVTQLASGTPVQQVFAQQAGQFVQVFQQAGISLSRFAGPLAALAVPLTIAGTLLWEMGKKGREAAAAIETFAEVEKKLQAVLERSNELTKTSIELARLKAQAAKDGAAASLREQEIAANAAFVAQGDKVAGLRKRDEAKAGPGYTSLETEQAEAEYERLFDILRKIDLAKADIQNKSPLRLADTVLTSSQPKAELEAKRSDIEASIVDARSRGDTDALMRLTEAYGAVNRAIATYVTDGERAVLVAEAQAKASGMTATEGQKYLTTRMAEINAMGKAVELGELERQQKAAQIDANAAAAKSYEDMAKAMSLGDIETTAKVQTSGLDAERQALAQRKALNEISAAEELAQAIAIEDRKRQVAENAAAAKLALLRRTAGIEKTEIDAAERAITELKAQHELERRRQMDEAAAARYAQAKQLAQIEAETNASSAGRKVDSKAEDVAMGKVTGNISGASEVAAAERAIASERYQIELDLLNEKLALAGQEPVERARILNDVRAAEEKHALQMKQIDRQATQSRLQEIKNWTEPFKSAMSQMVGAFISGTQTMRQLGARAMQSIAASYAGKAANWGFDKAATGVVTGIAGKEAALALGLGGSGASAAQTTALHANTIALEKLGGALGVNSASTSTNTTATGANTSMTATDATATATDATATTASAGATTVNSVATETNTTSMLSGFWEWLTGLFTNTVSENANTTALAANTVAQGGSSAAGGASFIGKLFGLSSAGGEMEVPSDGLLYQLHAKETVLPAAYATPLRSALTSGALSGKTATPEHIQSAMAALSGQFPGGKGMAAIGALAGGGGAGLGLGAMPRYDLPDWLRKGPNFEAAGSSTTNNVSKGGDTHVSIGPIHLNGKLRAEDLHDFEGAAIRAVSKGVRNGNPDALYITRKKG